MRFGLVLAIQPFAPFSIALNTAFTPAFGTAFTPAFTPALGAASGFVAFDDGFDPSVGYGMVQRHDKRSYMHYNQHGDGDSEAHGRETQRRFNDNVNGVHPPTLSADRRYLFRYDNYQRRGAKGDQQRKVGVFERLWNAPHRFPVVGQSSGAENQQPGEESADSPDRAAVLSIHSQTRFYHDAAGNYRV